MYKKRGNNHDVSVLMCVGCSGSRRWAAVRTCVVRLFLFLVAPLEKRKAKQIFKVPGCD
jgi:hypothetical protein